MKWHRRAAHHSSLSLGRDPMSQPLPGQTWLDETTWHQVQELVPIACVDIIPLRTPASSDSMSIGLIRRHTPHQGERWCVVGGRVLRNESLAEAVTRHLHETLGSEIDFDTSSAPLFIAEYFTTRRPGFLYDPRQHAIAATYAFEIRGEPRASGEASRFQWFHSASLPPRDEFGFQQDLVVEKALTALGVKPESLRFRQKSDPLV